jgi:hypothetical protein
MINQILTRRAETIRSRHGFSAVSFRLRFFFLERLSFPRR